MLDGEMVEWIKTEFQPLSLATPDKTILQCVVNAKRKWNTSSAYPLVRMYDVPGSINSNAGLGGNRIQLDPDYKNVIKVYPSITPDWILQNYPLWSLLGITIIDNLTSDLIELSEAYRNYRYYIGTDFQYKYIKSEDPWVGGYLNLVNMPSNATKAAVVGTKRIVYGGVTVPIMGITGTFSFIPVEVTTLSMTDGTQTYTDNGNGVLVSSSSNFANGTINYLTGAWTVPGWTVGVTTPITATYEYTEDVKSEYMLNWLLPYIKALVKKVEGNTLRKASSINVANDGQEMMDEGKEECIDLEKRLMEDGRWTAFARRF